MTREEIKKKAFEAYPEIEGSTFDDDLANTFHGYKREGYIKALAEINKLPKVHGWVARDKCGSLYLFAPEKPKRCGKSYWMNTHMDLCELPNKMFPALSWEDDPIEVELIIREV